MIRKVRDLSKEFAKNGGLWVTISSLLAKGSGLILAMIVARFLTKDEYGAISYARALSAPVLPLLGFGLNFSLLRFGPNHKSEEDLYRTTTVFATIATLFICVIFILLLPFLTKSMPSAQPYAFLLGLSFIPVTLMQVKQSFFRVKEQNKRFSQFNMFMTTLTFILVPLSILAGGALYYVAVSIFVPLIACAIYRSNVKKSIVQFSKKSFPSGYIWFGLSSGFASVMYAIVSMMEVYQLSVILSDTTSVALYRVGVNLPVQLAILPGILMTTNAVAIIKQAKNRVYAVNAIKKNLAMLGFAGVLLALLLFFFSDFVVTLLFSEKYKDASIILKIASISIPLVFIRAPIGMILSARMTGKRAALVAGVSSTTTLIVSYCTNQFFINKYGVIGAAVSSVIVAVLTVVIPSLLLWFNLQKEVSFEE